MLIERKYDEASGEPDYNCLVQIRPLLEDYVIEFLDQLQTLFQCSVSDCVFGES